MRLSARVLAVVAAASLTLTPAIARGGPAGPQKSGKPTGAGKPTTSAVPKTTSKPTPKPAMTSQAASTTRTSGKPTTTGKPIKSPSTKPVAGAKPTKSTSGKPTATTSAASTTKSGTAHTKSTTTATTSTTTTLNPIAEKIASKPNLNTKLTAMLPIDPMTGKTMTLDKASLGFKNQGQFIAALHVSENLGIPFTELKSHMVTVTPGAPGEQPTATQTGSLGQAIQASKATADVGTEVARAEQQTSADLRISTSTTTTTVKTTPKGGAR